VGLELVPGSVMEVSWYARTRRGGCGSVGNREWACFRVAVGCGWRGGRDGYHGSSSCGGRRMSVRRKESRDWTSCWMRRRVVSSERWGLSIVGGEV
jgi:hypothetical protein